MHAGSPTLQPDPAASAPDSRIARLLVLAFATFTFVSAFFHVSDPDVGYHIRTGAHIRETGRIPDKNTFSFSIPDHPWTLQQWWPATVYSVVWERGGLGALIAFKALLATAMMLVTLVAARRETGPSSWWPFWVMTLTVLVARVRFFERPDMVTALLFATLVCVDAGKARDRRWHLVGVPLLMAFWANTHAGYIYGLLLLCCWSAAEWGEWMRLGKRGQARGPFKELLIRPAGIAIAVVASLVATQLINPSGYRVMLVPIEQFLDPFWRAVISEYLPPPWEFSKLFYIWVATLVVLQAAHVRQAQLRFLIPTLVFGYLACATQRSLLVFMIVAAPHAAFLLSQLAPVRHHLVRRAKWALLVPVWLALALIVTRKPGLPFGVGLHQLYYPMSVFHFMEREVPAQRVFNEMRFGGPMLWWLWPKFPPFIDGRGDAFTPEFWQKEFLPVLYAQPGWKEKLAAHDIYGVLLPIIRDGQVPMLARALREDPQWALVAFSDTAMLFLERTATNQAVIARHEFRQLWPGDWMASNTKPVDASALAEAERAVALSPESIFAQTTLARAALAAGKLDRAAELLAALTSRGNANESYWSYHGYALFHLGRLDEAQQVFETMTRRKLSPGYAWFMRHHIALRRANPAEADRCLNEALHISPESPEYRNARVRLDATLKSR